MQTRGTNDFHHTLIENFWLNNINKHSKFFFFKAMTLSRWWFKPFSLQTIEKEREKGWGENRVWNGVTESVNQYVKNYLAPTFLDKRKLSPNNKILSIEIKIKVLVSWRLSHSINYILTSTVDAHHEKHVVLHITQLLHLYSLSFSLFLSEIKTDSMKVNLSFNKLEILIDGP